MMLLRKPDARRWMRCCGTCKTACRLRLLGVTKIAAPESLR
jgi:hypothetical protein